MKEKEIERKLVEEVKKAGGLCIKINSESMNGLPDRLVLLPDEMCGWVELKAPGEKPRPLQIKRHSQLRALGQKVFVIDGKEQIGGVLDAIRQKGFASISSIQH